MRRAMCAVVGLGAVGLLAPVASAQVLRVGTYHGIPGQYSSI
jgi:hypothetical protein